MMINTQQSLYHNSGVQLLILRNSYRSLVDLEQLKVPNIGPSRRNATKIRLEGTSLIGPLSSSISREKSSQDFDDQ